MMQEHLAHGIATAYWDSIGYGWRIDCLCGYTTTANIEMARTGEEFDDHMEEYVV